MNLDDLINSLPSRSEKLEFYTLRQIEDAHRSSYRKDLELNIPETQEEGLKLLRELKREQLCPIKELGSYSKTDYNRFVMEMNGDFINPYKYY